jgi:hypothetical protein
MAEAQQLWDAVNDPLLRAALEKFFQYSERRAKDDLVQLVLQAHRDTMKEAKQAGAATVYHDFLRDLEIFAKKQIEEAAE